MIARRLAARARQHAAQALVGHALLTGAASVRGLLALLRATRHCCACFDRRARLTVVFISGKSWINRLTVEVA